MFRFSALLALFLTFLASQSFAGDTRTIKVGEKFTLELASNITTGFQWQFAEPLGENIVRFTGNEYKIDPQAAKNMVGVGGVEYWTFVGVNPGTVTISLKYVRSWEKDVPPKKTETYKIIVK